MGSKRLLFLWIGHRSRIIASKHRTTSATASMPLQVAESHGRWESSLVKATLAQRYWLTPATIGSLGNLAFNPGRSPASGYAFPLRLEDRSALRAAAPTPHSCTS